MSSFRKRNVQKPIPGTRTSPQTGQVITSSGNPSLDLLLGGGLPIGSICLIEEDKYVTYSKVLAKYFLAEGILSSQTVFLGSLDDVPAEMLRKLPKPLNEEEVEKSNADDGEAQLSGGDGQQQQQNGLRIAWRYNDLPLVNSEQTTAKIGHHFNLMEQIDPLLLEYAETILWNDKQQSAVEESADTTEEDKDSFISEVENTLNLAVSAENRGLGIENMDTTQNADSNNTTTTTETAESGGDMEKCEKFPIFDNEKFLNIYNEIHPLLREKKFFPNTFGQKGLCRICITALGSPLWYDEQFPKDILKFLTMLRAAVRGAVSVCFITMPMHLIAKLDETLVAKIRNLVDYSIELESFAGSEQETNPAFKEYHGLLHLRKITAINTLSAYMPETTDLAFKLRRKKFVIEKLHLPPELAENNNSNVATGPSAEIMPTPSCTANLNTNPKASLDF